MTVPQVKQDDQSQYSRPYKSRRQRPCDFCRKRKSCCIIEGTLPCKLCRNCKRECTFVEGPISRPKPKLDENGQRIVTRKRSVSTMKKDSATTTTTETEKPRKKRGRKPKAETLDQMPNHSSFSVQSSFDNNLIDPSLSSITKPAAVMRRFSAPVSEMKKYKKPVLDLELLNEQQDLMGNTNEMLLENLHYSLEDHNNSQGLLAGSNNNNNWRNIFGFLVDSPLLQPQRLNDISRSPFLSGTIPEHLLLTGENPTFEQSNNIFANSNSSSASQISTIVPTESVTSFDSPGSSISGGTISQHEFNDFTTSKSLSGFQFIPAESSTSYIDPFIFSLLGHDNNKEDINLSENVKMNKLNGPIMMNYSTDESKRMTSKYMNHQREIFSILDNYGDRLINLYLTYVNPFMPILSKSQINFIFSNGDFNKASVISSLKRLNLSLVASIIASSLEYWDLDNELILDESPEVQKISEMAFDLIFSEFDLRNFSNAQSGYDLLQACLIICIKCSFDVTKLDHLYKINLLSRMISISHSIVLELGLNVDYSLNDSQNDDELIFRNNLWWCFYVQEKWFALLTGKQSLIHEDNYNVKIHIQTPSDIVPESATSGICKIENGVDYSNYETLHKSCSKYFEEMIKLTLILSEVLNKLYKVNENETHLADFTKLFEASDLVSKLEEKLLNWKDQLPENFRFQNGPDEEGVVNNQSRIGGYVNADATLQISYYVTYLTIHKALLKKFSNKYMQIASTTAIDDNDNLKQFENKFNNLKLNAIKISIDCAKTIKTLKLQDLNGFWYLFTNFKFIFITNFYILLHMVVDKTSNDLSPLQPSSVTDLSHSANYNNNLQFKSTMQKIITDFRTCVKNRSSKWKIARLANSLFNNFKSFEDFNILENYLKSSTPSSFTDKRQDNVKKLDIDLSEPEPLSLDDDLPKYELLNYEEKFIIV